MEVNYRWKKHYRTAKYPIRQPAWLTWVIWILSKICLIGKEYTLETIDMEGLKPPYIIFSNHMAFIDFELAAMVTHPKKVNNVVNIDGYHMMPWLLTWIGSICTRKFTNDFHLVKSIRRVLQNGDILCMYPEARYTPIGTTSFLPDSLGRVVKMNKVPLVVVTHHGNHLYSPFWAYKNKRKVPMHTVFRQVLTAKQVEEMSVEQINAAIRSAMEYDEYRYQLEKGIRITEAYRAEGLQKVLYQCPHCGTEFQMGTKGALAEHPNIAGLKEASGDMSQVVDIAARCEGKLHLYSGEDALTVPMMSVGGLGCISVLSNVVPKQAVEMTDRFFAGDVTGAGALQRQLLPLVHALFSEVNPIPAKAAVSAMGFGEEHIRMPLTPMEPENRENLYLQMRKLGVLV